MIKLTEFTQVVDIYKKNFNLRKKKFDNQKKKDTVEKREKREARIEVKKVFGIDKLGNKVADKSGNLLDNAIRFAGFALLGVIVKNIDKIARFAKTIIDKIKQYAIQFKNYFDNTLKPIFLQIFDVGKAIGGAFVGIAKFVIDIFPYNELSDLLDTVMSGILAIGYRIANFYKPFTSPTPPGSVPARAPVETPVKTPSKVETPVTVKQPTSVASRIVKKTAAPQKTLVSAGSGMRSVSKTIGRSGSPSSFLGDSLKTMLSDLDKSRIRGAYSQFPFVPETKNVLDDFTKEYLRLKKIFKYYSDTDLISVTNDLNQPLSVRKAAYDLLEGKGKSDRVINVPKTPRGFKLPQINVKDTMRGKRFFAPDIPKPPERLSLFKKLTKGLDFTFDVKAIIKEQILNPKNLLKNIKNIGVGIGIDVSLRTLGSFIGNIVPYDEDFELLGMLGMVNPDRIFELTARKIANLPEVKKRRAIEKLQRDLTSNELIVGSQKRKVAKSILTFVEIFDKKGKPQSIKPQVPIAIPGTSKQPVDPKKPPGVPYSDQEYVYPDGSTLKPGDIVGSVNNINGLDGATTYGSDRGMMISREVTYVLQTIEKEVLVPA